MRNEVLSTLRGEQTGCAGRLSIGATAPATLQWVPELMKKFCERHPLVRVEIVSDQPEKLLGDVADRKIDAAFFPTHPIAYRPKTGFVLTPLTIFTVNEPIWLALPRAGRSHTLKMFEEMLSSGSTAAMEPGQQRRPKKHVFCASTLRVKRTNSSV